LRNSGKIAGKSGTAPFFGNIGHIGKVVGQENYGCVCGGETRVSYLKGKLGRGDRKARIINHRSATSQFGLLVEKDPLSDPKIEPSSLTGQL